MYFNLWKNQIYQTQSGSAMQKNKTKQNKNTKKQKTNKKQNKVVTSGAFTSKYFLKIFS